MITECYKNHHLYDVLFDKKVSEWLRNSKNSNVNWLFLNARRDEMVCCWIPKHSSSKLDVGKIAFALKSLSIFLTSLLVSYWKISVNDWIEVYEKNVKQ